jgi:serine/threonine-protein kinase
MAHVYLGRARIIGGDRLAAVKVMRHDFGGDEQALHMFFDEAKLLSRLSHPNIIQTLEFGTTDEHPFIAMELLLGRTVMDVWEACVKQGIAIRFDLAAWIAARLADALHYAHELTDETGTPLNLIHRDVNPSNVFVTFDGKVKLFDFGLAKAQSRRAKSTTGIVKGKLPYLSPEQIMELSLDKRSDIYTLGTTLWEMTTMRRLFKRENDVETVRAVRSALIPDPEQLITGYPAPLAAIVRKSLERNREHRYQTAKEFATALDMYLAQIGTPDPSSVIPAMLDRLFPGERARQMGWLKTAIAPGSYRNSLTPPLPIPMQRSPGDSMMPTPPPSVPTSAPRSAPGSGPVLTPRSGAIPPAAQTPPSLPVPTPRSSPTPTPRSVPPPPPPPKSRK